MGLIARFNLNIPALNAQAYDAGRRARLPQMPHNRIFPKNQHRLVRCRG